MPVIEAELKPLPSIVTPVAPGKTLMPACTPGGATIATDLLTVKIP